MTKKSILVCAIIAGLAFAQGALARPSLSSIDQKLDQLLAGQEELREGQEQLRSGQQAILDELDLLRAQLGLTLAKCADLEFSGTIWGEQASGIDLRRFTNSTLHFIGCNGDGCGADTFFCEFDTATLTLTFGTTSSGALRALVDPGNAAGDDISGDPGFGCASTSSPYKLHNAPDKPEDASALCRALGYADGTVEAVNSNSCPEPTSLDADGKDWTSDYVTSFGFGRVFTCSGVD